jgi:hypothetical protein
MMWDLVLGYENPWWHAAKKANDQRLKELLDADEGQNVDSMDDKGRTTLFFAAGVSSEKCGLALAQLGGVYRNSQLAMSTPVSWKKKRITRAAPPWASLRPRSRRKNPSNQPHAIHEKNGAGPGMLLEKPIPLGLSVISKNSSSEPYARDVHSW